MSRLILDDDWRRGELRLRFFEVYMKLFLRGVEEAIAEQRATIEECDRVAGKVLAHYRYLRALVRNDH